MKPNTKYTKNGKQCFMNPFDGGEAITQFAYSGYSHAGSTAIDVAQGVGNKEAYYAPADMKCVKVDLQFCFTWWQTIKECYLADGTIGHATIMIGHDETINSYVGQTIAQGVQIGNMGNGGNSQGVHCHIEVAKGHQNDWIPNAQGVYVLPNATLIENVCFMDDSNFTNVNMNDADFHYTKEIKEKPISNNKKAKYNIGLPVTFTGVWHSSTATNGATQWTWKQNLVYKEGIISEKIDAEHPYLVKAYDGTTIGWIDDGCIDDEPSVPTDY